MTYENHQNEHFAESQSKKQSQQNIINQLLVLLIGVVWIFSANCTFADQLTFKPLNEIELSNRGIGSTINTVIFRSRDVVFRDGFQFTEYYDTNGRLLGVKRNLITHKIDFHVIQGQFNTKIGSVDVVVKGGREAPILLNVEKSVNTLCCS